MLFHRSLLGAAGVLLLAACVESPTPPEPEPFAPDALQPAGRRVVGLATGFSSTCALTEPGKVYCWGENRFGEFGDGTHASSAAPVKAFTSVRFARIVGTAGTARTCGLAADGAAYCWGYNFNGEVGDGTKANRAVPTPVATTVRFRDIATSYHTCGVATEGDAYCWGPGLAGALGPGTPPDQDHATPAPVAGGRKFTSIGTGMEFTCALETTGEAFCWGWGAMLGSGTSETRYAPHPVAGGRKYQALSVGEEMACALTAAGEAWCWGKLGGPFAEVQLTPVRVSTELFRQVAVGDYHACGITVDGAALCWRTGSDLVEVPGRIPFAALSSGQHYTCGYTPGGNAYCWSFGPFDGKVRDFARIPTLPG